MNHVGIAVIHYRTPDLLEHCLRAIARSAPHSPVVLVDTAPDRETFALAKRIIPHVHIISAPNHSYAHSVNVGLNALSTPYLVQMNADVFIEPDTLPALVATARREHHRAIVGPTLRTTDGTLQNMGPVYAINYARLAFAATPSVPVSWLSGAMQLIPRQVINEIGGYNEQFRFTNEDIEYSWRARQRGITSQLTACNVTHVGGASTPTAPAFFIEGRRGSYLLTARFHGEAAARLHRWYLHAEARLGPLIAPRNEQLRAALHAQRERLLAGTFTESPFGATLADYEL